MGTIIEDGRHFPTFAEYKVVQGTAKTYSFRFDEPFGWAIFTVNDTTGEFHIQSDYGQWQYCWGIGNLGGPKERQIVKDMPLTYFLAVRPDAHYVAMKFGYNKEQNFANYPSMEKTAAAFRMRIINARLLSKDNQFPVDEYIELLNKFLGRDNDIEDHGDFDLTKEAARNLWESLGEWEANYSLKNQAEQVIAVHDMQECHPDLYNFISHREGSFIRNEVYEDFENEASHEYLLLTRHLLPFFFTYLRENVLCVNKVGEPVVD